MSPFRTLIAFAVLSLIGLGLAPRLSLDFLPPADKASLAVSYAWPDAAPELMERELTTPLEGAFALVDGVQKISSVSRTGSGRITLQLDKKSDPDLLRFEIASRIRQVYADFPEGAGYPLISLYDPEDDRTSDRPMLTYTLSGNEDLAELYRYASETLAPQLALNEGIYHIETTGGAQKEWLLRYDRNRMENLGLTPEDFRRAVNDYLQQADLGLANDGERTFQVRLREDGERARWGERVRGSPPPPEATADEKGSESAFAGGYGGWEGESRPAGEGINWRMIPLKETGGRIIRLGDVAEANFQDQRPQTYYRVNGRNSVRLLFYPEEGVNTIRLARKMRTRIADAELPAGCRLYLDDDATEYMAAELHKIRDRTLLSIGILLFFVLMAYRSWRYLLLISLALVVNLGLAFLLYYWAGVRLHLYGLAGITVSFGIIIDNAIVMAHHWRSYRDRKVFPALVSSTLTTIAALVVVFYLPDEWRRNLEDFGKVMIINLAASLATAYWLIPVLMGKLGLENRLEGRVRPASRRAVRWNRRYLAFLTFFHRRRWLTITAAVLAFGLPVFMLPNKVEGWDWYNKTLGSDWYVENAKPVVNRVLGGSLRLFAWYVYEGGGYRQPEETVLYVQASLPPGGTPEQMDDLIRKLEAYLGQYNREIRQYVSQVYGGDFGQVTVRFNKAYELSFPYLLKNRVVAYSTNLGGAKWNVYGVGQSFSNETGQGTPSFRVNLYGYNRDELQRQAERFAGKLLAHPRIQEVNTEANVNFWEKDRYAYNLSLNRPKMALAGISLPRVAGLLESFDQSGQYGGRLPDGVPIRVADRNLAQNDKWILENLPRRQDSVRISMGNIAELTKEKISAGLYKEDQQYIRTIAFEYTGSYRFGAKYLEECMAEMRKEMPLGYTLQQLKGWNFGRERKRMYWLMGLVMGLIFFICAIHFESLRKALLILLLIPLSFIGIFLTFYLGDFYFDQGGYTSFILVSGLSVNNLILILSDYNRYRIRQPHRSPVALYLKAWRHEIIPILMSLLTTALGLIPFMLQGDLEVFWFSLAAGSIGGLAWSLVVVSWITPAFLEVRGFI